MNNQTNQKSDTVIARGTTKGPSRDGQKTITKLFFEAEKVSAIIELLNQALSQAQDGVSISIIEGVGKTGKPYALLGASGMEARAEGQGYNGPKKAYAPRDNAPAAPQGGGYKPKSPGYKGYGK